MTDTSMPAFLARGPVLLNPDNFVPLTRTPWGGEVIGRTIKRALVPAAVGQTIGESWEFSCDPSFPSKAQGPQGVMDLTQLVEAWPDAVFSPERVRSGQGQCEILVKLLNAADPLSVQVHPADDDANLQPGECGKPESWLVLHAEPGAGIYMGFSRALSRAALRTALQDGAAARELLYFQPVQPGDYFEIEPGVPHAIGTGVTLLEPQRVLQGKSGKTFRLWDWGRLYDDQGQQDPVAGKPRALHIEEGLRLVDPERQVGAAFVATLRRQAVVTRRGGCEVLAFPANPYYRTTLVRGVPGATLTLDIRGGYGALLTLGGRWRCGQTALLAGQPALLPAAASPLTFTAETAGEFAVVTPAYCTVEY